jgi:hypothetical protein
LETEIMGKQYKSPYATSFKSAVKRGTPWNVAVENIAKNKKTTVASVWQSLFKGGDAYRFKFNGQWFYFPTQGWKTNAKSWKEDQFWMWQWFINYGVANGWFTPDDIRKHCGSQKEFMTYFKKFWNRQFTTSTSKNTRKRTTRRNKSTRTRAKRSTTTRSYKFPQTRTRRYRRAA